MILGKLHYAPYVKVWTLLYYKRGFQEGLPKDFEDYATRTSAWQKTK